jgi:hypothetical protein
MSAPRDRVEELKTRPKAELKRILGDELGSNYIQPVTGSLRNDFMLACYRRLDTGDHPKERLQSHENYTPAWKQKKRLATALRMVLTERVGHPEHKGITSLDKAVLAELIVGIRMCGDELEASTESGDEDPASDNVEVPREPPVPCHFEGTLPAEEFDSYALYDWVVNRRSQTDGEHGVYVLDCTPPFAEAEDFRVKALRADAKQKTSLTSS